jgi:cell division protein FtsB
LQLEHNQSLESRNARVETEIMNLKNGLDAVEERARSELGMIKKDELFYQLIPAY